MLVLGHTHALEEREDICTEKSKDLLPYGCGVVLKVSDFEHKS